MAWGDLVDAQSTNGSGLTTGLNVDVAVSAGDLIVVMNCSGAAGAEASGVSDDDSNTYNSAMNESDVPSADCWWTVAGSDNATLTVSGSWSNTPDHAFGVAVFEGPFDASPLDAASAVTEDAVSPHTTGDTGTLSSGVKLIISAIAMYDGAIGTPLGDGGTPDGGMTEALEQDDTDDACLYIGYYTTTSTTGQNPSWTNSGIDDTNGITLAFLPGAQSLTVPLYTNSQTFYSPTVTPGGITGAPSLYTNTNAVYAPTISAVNPLTVPAFANTSSIYGPTVTLIMGITTTSILRLPVDYVLASLQRMDEWYWSKEQGGKVSEHRPVMKSGGAIEPVSHFLKSKGVK